MNYFIIPYYYEMKFFIIIKFCYDNFLKFKNF